MKDYARCGVEGCDGQVKCNNGTGGLKKHLQYKHPELFDEIIRQQYRSQHPASSKFARISSFLTKKSKAKSVNDIKAAVQQAVASWVIDSNSPLAAIESESFRQMFHPLHDKAPAILSIGRHKIREEIVKTGTVAVDATTKELHKHYLAITTDHWTSPADDTYSVVTGHYIEDWNLCSVIIDFKVWHGSTTGDLLGQDLMGVVRKNAMFAKLLIAVTDTTGNMVTLGRHLREQEVEHAFCIDHNLHRNALLAFDGENYHIIYACIIYTFTINTCFLLYYRQELPWSRRCHEQSKEYC